MSGRSRLPPEQRRQQLLDLGVELLRTRGLDELTIEVIAEEGGISRGLIYHYFTDIRAFHLQVHERFSDELLSVTAPDPELGPWQALGKCLTAYIGFVAANAVPYLAFVRAARGGDADFLAIYQTSRAALTDRVFGAATPEALDHMGLRDDAATRLSLYGWSGYVEDTMTAWLADDHGLSRADLAANFVQAFSSLVSQPQRRDLSP